MDLTAAAIGVQSDRRMVAIRVMIVAADLCFGRRRGDVCGCGDGSVFSRIEAAEEEMYVAADFGRRGNERGGQSVFFGCVKNL